MLPFLRRYWRWVLSLGFTNWLIWIGFELVHSQQLTVKDLWPLRMYLASGLLLFDNLCVLWWYADSTRRQLELSSKDYLERNKPVVFVDRVEPSDRQGGFYYVARNVGGGYAINAYYFSVEIISPVSVGALAAGEERRLPPAINEYLCAGGVVKHLVVAEAPYTRTTQWTPTLNLRTQEGGEHRGQVMHRSPTVRVQPPRFQYQRLQDYMQSNVRSFREQLKAFEEGDLSVRLLNEGG